MGNKQSASPPPSAATAKDDAHIREAAIESVRLEDHVSRLSAATNNGRQNPTPTSSTNNNTDDIDDTYSSKVPCNKSGTSKQVTDCRVEQRASLACIEQNYATKDMACQKYFEEYKKCRKAEHERKLDANAKAW
jgi:hypothetical protein